MKTTDIPSYQFGSLPDDSKVPGKQTKFLSPRYEPSNITQNATVLQVQDAIRQAENGQTQELFRFYRDVLLSDDHIQSEIRTRKLAMLAQPMVILPMDKNNPDDIKLAAALMQAKDDCENWNDGMLALLDSHATWPVSIVERLYQPQPDPKGRKVIPLNFTFKKFVPVNYQLLCYQWAYMTGGVGLGTASAIQLSQLGTADSGTGAPNPYTIDLEKWEPYIKLWPIDLAGRIIYDVTRAEYLDTQRHICHRGHDLTTFRDNWGGPARSILMWWLFRGLGRGWFATGMERFGQPYPVAYTDINDPASVQLLRDAFDFARKIGGLVVSENSRVELIQAMTQGMSQGYETFIKLCNDAISKHITGKDSTSKPAGLNSGQSDSQENVRQDYRIFDQMRMNETLLKQVALPFRDINGLGSGRVKFAWGGLSAEDAAAFADLLLKMKQSGLEPDDASLPVVNERTGLSWQRAAPPEPPQLPGSDLEDKNNPKTKDDDDDVIGKPKTLSVGRLIRLNSAPRTTQSELPDPMDAIVKAQVTTLAASYRGAMAPFRQAILESNSKADCLKRLTALFPDWSPTRLNAELETALQLCAAAGAASAVEQK